MPWTPLLGPPVRVVAERQQRGDVVVGDQPHVAALAAVAAVGPAEGDRALPPERHAARATVAAAHVELALVDELGHRVHATGRLGRGRGTVRRRWDRARADTPSVCLASMSETDASMQERADRWASTMARRAAPTTCALAHADSSRRHGCGSDQPDRSPGSRARTALRRRHACGRGRRIGAGRRSPTSGARASSATATASSTPPAFRRLAGKTQVFVFPDDHQRTRLTHALEVAQVATSVARALGLNVALTEAIALGHDCGHGPGGHASEDALSPYVAGGYDHAVWGADVTLAPLNLCAETLDGIRNHSWSRPAPATPEGEVVSWADRIAYVCHDFEDAVAAGIVGADMLPPIVADALRTSPVAAARHVHPGDGRATAADRADRHDRAGRRGAGRVPPLQLRARLPPPGQPRPRPTR